MLISSWNAIISGGMPELCKLIMVCCWLSAIYDELYPEAIDILLLLFVIATSFTARLIITTTNNLYV
jgi:hypothetical protein